MTKLRISQFLIALLLLSSLSFATTTISGSLKNLGTGAVSSGSFVRLWLRGCGGNTPRVNGTAVIAPSQGGVYFIDLIPDGSGNITGTVYSNRDATGLLAGEIECGGSKTSTWYGIQVFYQGKGGPEQPAFANNTGTLNITNFTPLTVSPAPAASGVVLLQPSGSQTISQPANTAFKVIGGNGIDAGNSVFTNANNPFPLNGIVYGGGSGGLNVTAAGGAGTLCLVSTAGGTPVFASCAGSASTSWSALSAPSGNLTLNVGSNTSTFNGTGSITFNNPIAIANGSASTFSGLVTLSAGAAISGTLSGGPNISGAPIFTGTPLFSGLPEIKLSTGYNVSSLPSAASNTGGLVEVDDSTAIASEGQTCVGGSSNHALAFSNGSVWKCF